MAYPLPRQFPIPGERSFSSLYHFILRKLLWLQLAV